MPATSLQPILPWSGGEEEDRRFRRILVAVLAATSLLSAILPHIPVPRIEPDRARDAAPAVVRMIGQPITLPAPPSVQSGAREQSPAPAPEPQAVVTHKPQTPRPVARVVEPPPVSRPEPQRPRQAAPLTRQAKGAAAPPQRQNDPMVPATEKAAKTGVLALRDALVALREFTPSTPARGGGSGTEVVDRPADNEKPSLLNKDVARGSGGIGAGIPAPREILGLHRMQGQGSGASGLAGFQVPPAGGGGRGGGVHGKSRSEDEIQEVLDRHKRAIYTIYNRELRKDPSLQGKVVVSITIAPSGKVTDCRIEYSELKSDALKKQLIRLIKRVDFGPKRDVPPVTTKVPIEFFPV
jgi:TonB family protein